MGSYSISQEKRPIIYSGVFPESVTDKFKNSIVKIKTNNGNIETGFFIKIYIEKNELLFLVACYHALSQYPAQNIQINFTYGRIKEENKKSIILDKRRRFIVFNNLIDIILIQIIEDDKIPRDNFLLMDYNYLNGLQVYENKDCWAAEYSLKGERGISIGKILKVNSNNNYEFMHSLGDKYSSSGCPICLIENKCVIGIHTKIDTNNIKYGSFIGTIIYQLEKEYNNRISMTNTNTAIKIDTKEKEKKIVTKGTIDLLDFIIFKNCSPYEDYYKFFYFLKCNDSQTIFINTSIFDKKKYDDIKNKFFNKFQNNNFDELEKSCIGSILGMTIGDAIGSRVEFNPINYEFKKLKDMGEFPEGKYRLKPGQWTENTSMGLCIADSLIENNGEFNPRDIMMRFILWWKYGYNNPFRFDNKRKDKSSVGLYGTSKKSLNDYINNKGNDIYSKSGDKNSSGNGPLIRNAAIPICFFRDEKKTLDFAKKQSQITHQSDESSACCQLLTYIIVKIFKLKEKSKGLNSKTQINNYILPNNYDSESLRGILNNLKSFSSTINSVNNLARSLKEDNNRDWNWKSQNFKYNEERAKNNPTTIGSYCMDGLAMALHAIYTTNDFKSAILKVANLCGDSGAVATIVGQIAGAFYGLDFIPKDWIKKLNLWDKNEIALRGYILYHLK